MLRFFILVITACTPLFAFAQAKVEASKPIRLEYASKSWNRNPGVEDTGTVLMRDVRTQKIVQIQLTESGPDTGSFWGSYSVSWGESEIIPEIYLPPQDILQNAANFQKIEDMIKEGVLLRKPYFAKADSKGNHSLMIFDTKEQALEAFDEYRKLRTQIASPVGQSALETQVNATFENEKKAQEQLSEKLEADRKILEAEERNRLEQLRKKFDQLSPKEKENQKAQAQNLFSDASKLFGEGKFTEAAAQNLKTIELAPYNSNYIHRYGVILYRTEKYLLSVVYLQLADSPAQAQNERDFYIAMDYMKLNEVQPALSRFQDLKSRNDKTWSSQGALYSGVLKFQIEEYEASRPDFEYVLDHSEDPAIDKLAEAYIEQIANAVAFKKEQSKKLLITLNGGLLYDSNILSTANSQLDQPTDLAGYRWSYGGTIEYRPVYKADKEFSVILGASDLYSTDTKFIAAQNFQNTDPLVYSLYFPYKHKGLAFKKGYQMTLSPGVEQTLMNADGVSSREVILNSRVLKNEHLHSIRDDWFSNITIEYREETSLIDTTTSPLENLTSNRWTFGTSQIFFQNDKKTEAWIGDFSWAKNAAQGHNAEYERYDIAATYMAPWKWDTTWTSRLSYYNATYPRHLVGRNDKNTTLILGLRKPLTPNLAATLSGVYTINQSTLDSSDYRKYMILTTFSWTTSL